MKHQKQRFCDHWTHLVTIQFPRCLYIISTHSLYWYQYIIYHAVDIDFETVYFELSWGLLFSPLSQARECSPGQEVGGEQPRAPATQEDGWGVGFLLSFKQAVWLEWVWYVLSSGGRLGGCWVGDWGTGDPGTHQGRGGQRQTGQVQGTDVASF